MIKRLSLVLAIVLVLVASLLIVHFADASPFTALHHTKSVSRTYVLPLEGQTLFAIGDSLTGGFYASVQAKDYISLMTHALGPRLLPPESRYGVTIPRTLAALQQTPPPFADNYIVELGTNDTNESLSEISTDYQQIIAILHHANPHARFVCMGPWQSYTTQHNAIAAIVKQDCPAGHFVDMQAIYYADNLGYHGPAGRPTWLGPGDWFHPNDLGHAAIASAVENAFFS